MNVKITKLSTINLKICLKHIKIIIILGLVNSLLKTYIIKEKYTYNKKSCVFYMVCYDTIL